MTVLDTRHDDLLNRVEDLELLSLRWGDVSGSISRETILDLAAPVFAGGAEDAVEALLESGLIMAFNPPGSGERYRSRFAETVRLLARLRQTFPGEAWQGAPPLVVDYRLDLRKRRYPQRNLDAPAVLEELGERHRPSTARVACPDAAPLSVVSKACGAASPMPC